MTYRRLIPADELPDPPRLPRPQDAVRCRDCRHAVHRPPVRRGSYVTREEWLCRFFRSEYGGRLPEVQESGYCAWGER